MVQDRINIGKIIDEETEKRLEIMSSEDYEWPQRADRKDAIAIIATIFVCGVLVVVCMMGIIV